MADIILNQAAGPTEIFLDGGLRGEAGVGKAGPGVASGGNIGDIYIKTGAPDYAAGWITPTGNGAATALNLRSPDGTLWTMTIDNAGHTIWTSTTSPGVSNTFGLTYAQFTF